MFRAHDTTVGLLSNQWQDSDEEGDGEWMEGLSDVNSEARSRDQMDSPTGDIPLEDAVARRTRQHLHLDGPVFGLASSDDEFGRGNSGRRSQSSSNQHQGTSSDLDWRDDEYRTFLSTLWGAPSSAVDDGERRQQPQRHDLVNENAFASTSSPSMRHMNLEPQKSQNFTDFSRVTPAAAVALSKALDAPNQFESGPIDGENKLLLAANDVSGAEKAPGSGRKRQQALANPASFSGAAAASPGFHQQQNTPNTMSLTEDDDDYVENGQYDADDDDDEEEEEPLAPLSPSELADIVDDAQFNGLLVMNDFHLPSGGVDGSGRRSSPRTPRRRGAGVRAAVTAHSSSAVPKVLFPLSNGQHGEHSQQPHSTVHAAVDSTLSRTRDQPPEPPPRPTRKSASSALPPLPPLPSDTSLPPHQIIFARQLRSLSQKRRQQLEHKEAAVDSNTLLSSRSAADLVCAHFQLLVQLYLLALIELSPEIASLEARTKSNANVATSCWNLLQRALKRMNARDAGQWAALRHCYAAVHFASTLLARLHSHPIVDVNFICNVLDELKIPHSLHVKNISGVNSLFLKSKMTSNWKDWNQSVVRKFLPEEDHLLHLAVWRSGPTSHKNQFQWMGEAERLLPYYPQKSLISRFRRLANAQDKSVTSIIRSAKHAWTTPLTSDEYKMFLRNRRKFFKAREDDDGSVSDESDDEELIDFVRMAKLVFPNRPPNALKKLVLDHEDKLADEQHRRDLEEKRKRRRLEKRKLVKGKESKLSSSKRRKKQKGAAASNSSLSLSSLSHSSSSGEGEGGADIEKLALPSFPPLPAGFVREMPDPKPKTTRGRKRKESLASSSNQAAPKEMLRSLMVGSAEQIQREQAKAAVLAAVSANLGKSGGSSNRIPSSRRNQGKDLDGFESIQLRVTAKANKMRDVDGASKEKRGGARLPSVSSSADAMPFFKSRSSFSSTTSGSASRSSSSSKSASSDDGESSPDESFHLSEELSFMNKSTPSKSFLSSPIRRSPRKATRTSPRPVSWTREANRLLLDDGISSSPKGAEALSRTAPFLTLGVSIEDIRAQQQKIIQQWNNRKKNKKK